MEIIRNSVQTEHFCLYGVFFLARTERMCYYNQKKEHAFDKREGEMGGLFSDSERKDIV